MLAVLAACGPPGRGAAPASVASTPPGTGPAEPGGDQGPSPYREYLVGKACLDAAEELKDSHEDVELARATRLFERACDASFAEACDLLAVGRRYGVGGRPRDLPGAVAALTRACRLGHGPACTTLSQAHERGEMGLPRDAIRAAHYEGLDERGPQLSSTDEQRACAEDGQLPACRSALGRLHAACESGAAEACSELALLKLVASDGHAFPQDEVLSTARRGCQLGSHQACALVADRTEDSAACDVE